LGRFVVFGTVLGLGGATGITVLLWAPVLLGALLLRAEGRRQLRTAGPWLAAAVVVVLLLPYLVHDLGLSREGSGSLAFQVGKFRPLVWSWAPTALFIRPLYFHAVEGTISEYVAMTTVTGGPLLLGAVAGLTFSGWKARTVQALGWWPFLFFSFFSNPKGEFFWTDFALPPFILLTAASVFRLRKAAPFVAVALALVFAWRAVPLLRANERYFPLDWGPPPPRVVESYRNGQRALIAQFKSRDHLALTTVFGRHTPLSRYYLDSLVLYRNALVSDTPSGELHFRGWLAPSSRRHEDASWAQSEIERFEAAGVHGVSVQVP
jgi:hypothetical protein